MKFLKSVSRLLTIPVLGRERRKRARLEVEKALNALFRTEKYIYTRRFEQAAALNLSLPRQNFHVIHNKRRQENRRCRLICPYTRFRLWSNI